MRESIQLLLRLRQLDDELQLLRQKVGAHMADVQRRKTEADLARSSVEHERERLKDAQSKHREADMEVQTYRDSKAHFEKQMHDVKTNEEFQALQREIAATERKAHDWEDVVLEAMGEEETAQRTIQRSEAEHREKERLAAEEQSRVEKEREAAEIRAAEINKLRTELVAQLAAPVRAKYERLRAAKGEAVIVDVRSGSCGGCHYRLPPQTVNEVRRGDRLIQCESCGRILVWLPASSSAE